MTKVLVHCSVLRQHKRSLYLFSMNSKKLLDLTYVLPKSRDDPQQIQRSLDEGRVKRIGDYVQEPNCFLPNSIVLNLDKTVKFRAKGKSGGDLVFPQKKGKFGYILDGQHRLYGFKHSGHVQFDLPVVAFIAAPRDVAYKVFADINSLQSKVNEVLLQLLRYEIRDLGKTETVLSVSIVHDLNNELDSVLKGKIKVYPDDKKTWVNGPRLAKFLKPIVGPGGVLQGMPEKKATKVLKNYLRAIKGEYAVAWGNNDHYVLTKTMGIEIASALFPNVYQRCQRYEKQRTDVDSFRRQLKRIGKIHVPNQTDPIELDWSSKRFGALSSAKGISHLKTEVLLALPPMDANK
jgi:DGQHR domain-containing protein